jgi:hypothetical protein
VKAYVYFAIVCAGASTFCEACAYGQSEAQLDEHHDSGVVLHADAGAKDAAKPQQDAQVEQDVFVDPPDVLTTTCATLPLGTGIPECDTCIGSSCCNEDQACGNDQDCMGFISCINGCFNQVDGGVDEDCESSCESDYPNGANELSNLDSCMENSCPSQCGM